jgi:hypothetical protein
MKKLAIMNVAMLGLGLAETGCMFDMQGSAGDEIGSTAQAVKSENGLTSNGLTSNGLTSNGLTSNGLTSNGLTSNGLTSNGLTSNGLTSNGLTSNGLRAVNGLNTSNGLTSNGLRAVNGLKTSNGFTMNGLNTSNGLRTINGVAWSRGLHTIGDGRNAARAVAGDGRASFARLAASVGPAGLWLADALHSDGLSVRSGLSTETGLAHGVGLMESTQGQLVVGYMVKCALPTGRSVTKYDGNGDLHTFPGSIGVAPEWETGACGTSCQEWMTACLLSHVNLTGQHVNVWITAEHPAIDLAKSDDFPLEEAAFFGNLFTDTPEAYVCHGENAADRPIAGRVCDGASSCPYANPYVSGGGACTSRHACAAARMESGDTSGYASCTVGGATFSNVITTWKP